jgi:hypothetical protein
MVILNGSVANYISTDATDDKPTDAETGALLFVAPTKTFYYFDGEEWQKVGG